MPVYNEQALIIVEQIKALLKPYADYHGKEIALGPSFGLPKFDGFLLVTEHHRRIFISYLVAGIMNEPKDLIYMRFNKPLKLNQPIIDYLQENYIPREVDYL